MYEEKSKYQEAVQYKKDEQTTQIDDTPRENQNHGTTLMDKLTPLTRYLIKRCLEEKLFDKFWTKQP